MSGVPGSIKNRPEVSIGLIDGGPLGPDSAHPGQQLAVDEDLLGSDLLEVDMVRHDP